MNLSKYYNCSAIQGELGICSIDHRAYSLAIKYWLRLVRRTKNEILNDAFQIALNDQHDWIQSVQSLLCTNGFRYAWLNPHSLNQDYFHKQFRQRLDDQFIQNWRAKINASSRFKLLALLKESDDAFSKSKYIDKIKNPIVRETFTRLRVDMNILGTSMTNQTVENPSGTCRECTLGVPETPEHFLFDCNAFFGRREAVKHKIVDVDHRYDEMTKVERTRYIRNLDCPDEAISLCCKYVIDLYKLREGP